MEQLMYRPRLKPLHTLGLAAALLFSATVEARIVCWTNNEGIRECGNAVPPEYAQKETRTLNKRGMTTDVRERAKTPEELAAERAKQEEEERLAAEQAAREREQQRRDRVLLSTYLTEADIIRSRDRQSSSIDATIEITHISMDKLQQRLDAEKKKAARYERVGKPLPEALQSEIASLQSQIDDKQGFIERKEQEKQRLHEKYQADIARFRELKADGARLR